MEIELRARILDSALLEKKLNQLPGIVEKKSNERQVDIYLMQESDKERRMVIRIRKNYEKDEAMLTFKGKSSGDQDIAWQDYDTIIKDPDRLERLLVDNGYVYVCLIDKVRQSFNYKEFEINVDNIRDLGLFIEIEKQGNEEQVDSIKEEIIELLKIFGVSKTEIITRGYVQLILNDKK